MSLTVFYNGSRKKIKVSPIYLMQDVLREACLQYKLECDQFILRHRSTPIDLSLQFRLTGISNNATIELIRKSNTKEENKIRVCIQLPGGRRLQGTFSTTLSLSSILSSLNIDVKKCGSVTYMRQIIEGSLLSSTTLTSLGLNHGSALFRVTMLDKDETVTTHSLGSCTSTKSPKIIQEKISMENQVKHKKTMEKVDLQDKKELGHIPPASPITMNTSMMRDESSFNALPTSNSNEEMKINQVMTFEESLEAIRSNSFDAAASDTILLLLKIICNILSSPENEKLRSLRLSNNRIHQIIGKVPGGLEFLRCCGFISQEDTDRIILPFTSTETKCLEKAMILLKAQASDLNIDSSKIPQIKKKSENTNMSSAFDPFKEQIYRSQMQPRGPSITEQQVNTLLKKCEDIMPDTLSDRQIKIIFPHMNSLSLQEEYDSNSQNSISFNEESSLISNEIKRRRQELQKQQQLRTKAMRDLEELKKRRVYQEVCIRIQFPDRVILQARFHPNETVQVIYDVIQQCLNEMYQKQSFELFTTPPKTILSLDQTLLSSNLVPAASIYLTWHQKKDINQSIVGIYLNDFYQKESLEIADSKNSSSLPLNPTVYPKSIPLITEHTSIQNGSNLNSIQAESKTSNLKSKSKSSKGKPSWLKL